MVYHSIFQQMTFCQTSSPWPICLGWPHTAWLSFTELNRAVVHVIRLASCLWLWLQSVCPLMSSISAYNLTWVSLTLDEGYFLTAVPPDLEHGIAALGPPAPMQPPLLGRGVAPLGSRPWPQVWGSSSWPRFCVVCHSPGTSMWYQGNISCKDGLDKGQK